MILGPDTLDALFRRWLDDTESPWYQRRRYQNEPRRGRNQAFEDWLFSHGFTVIQDNKVRYLKYSGDPAEVTLFLLQYGA